MHALSALLTALLAPLPVQDLSSATSPAAQARPLDERASEPSPVHLVRMQGGESALRLVLALGLEVLGAPSTEGGFDVIVQESELLLLRERGLDFDVLIKDLARHYESRLASSPPAELGSFGGQLSPPFGQGAMGGYYTFNQVVSVLDQLRSAYPSRISARTSIGTSIEGRSLWAVKISDNPDTDELEPEVRFDALHHAREPESMQATLWLMLFLLESYGTDPLATYLVDQREMWFVPVVNPDGYVYNQTTNPGGGGMWRKNRRNNGDGSFGIDLNRNYPYQWGFDNEGSSPFTSSDLYRGPFPTSEPEVASMVSFISSRDFQTALSTHTSGNLWLYPWGYDFILPFNNSQYLEISTLATEVNGYTMGPAAATLYEANGVTIDYDFGTHGCLSWTAELGGPSDGFWPPTNRIIPLAEENLLGFQRIALAAGGFAYVLSSAVSEQSGDGDGFLEAGETVALVATARNSGVSATATSVALALSSQSPLATILDDQHDFGVLGPFSQSTNLAQPLLLEIDAQAQGGSVIDYTISLTYEGYTQDVEGSLFIGQPLDWIADDLELADGWIAGVPGDTATAGEWEFGDPIGTSSGAEQVNPENDDTPGSGHLCFVTGNGGGGAGTDDVDNGRTTLLSPLIDLSDVGPATISYARWFADLTTVDDIFEVSITNNDGFSWVNVENLTGNHNAWEDVSFEVGDLLAQTDHMRLRFIANDSPNNSLVEAAVDSVRVTIYDEAPKLAVYGDRSLGGQVTFNISGPAGARWYLAASRHPMAEAPPQSPAAFIALNPVPLPNGLIPPERVARVPGRIPANPNLSGSTLYYRAAVVQAGTAQFSNVAQVTLP